MLDGLYRDIGKKIKLWAKWIFVVEAIGAVITGLSILINGGEVVVALLTIVLGPCVALVSTWLLYAAGEAVDKICEIERNTRRSNNPALDTDDGTAMIHETQNNNSSHLSSDNNTDADAAEDAAKLICEPESDKIYTLNLQATVVPNLLFSKYDVVIHMDTKPVCTISHGTKQTVNIPVSHGEHKFTFSCCGDTSVEPVHKIVQIENDAQLSYSIECFRNKLGIFNALFDEESL